jgi:hypothetical protein
MSTAPDRSPTSSLTLARVLSPQATPVPGPPVGRNTLSRSKKPTNNLSSTTSTNRSASSSTSTRSTNWGSSSDDATRAALLAFAAKETLIKKRRWFCVAATATVIMILCIFAFFAVPRVPGVSVVSRDASTTSSIADISAGNFKLGVATVLAIDNTVNYFPVAFKDLVLILTTEKSKFASFADSRVFTVPAQSKASFTLSAQINTAVDTTAITNMVTLLGCADLATRASSLNNSLSTSVVGCIINVQATFTPLWLGTKLPRALTAFDVTLKK